MYIYTHILFDMYMHMMNMYMICILYCVYNVYDMSMYMCTSLWPWVGCSCLHL